MGRESPRRRRAEVEHVVSARGLTKTFGTIRAVDGLDLDVRRGEIFGYLGPNGAGKTTTIRMLLDFVRPTGGTARVLDTSPSEPAVRRRIGYVPGDLRFDPHYTARDVFDFYGTLRGGVDGGLLDGLCERFALDPSRRIGELSTGNRRKVGLIQAFMHRPELLLLDEPTSGLDPLLQYEFHVLVREATADGASVFLSSHLLHEVEQLADRVGILRAGRLVTVSTVAQLRGRARQRLRLYVRGKADAKPFVRLRGVVEAKTTGHTIEVVVKGSVEHVLKKAAEMHVHRIETHDTELEDVFLELYRTDRMDRSDSQ